MDHMPDTKRVKTIMHNIQYVGKRTQVHTSMFYLTYKHCTVLAV